MNLLQEILATAPKHEREFEVRLFDLAGRLVDILPMRREGNDFYVSETYARPERGGVIVTLFRDGAGVFVFAHNMTIYPGFNVNATIPDPERPLSDSW